MATAVASESDWNNIGATASTDISITADFTFTSIPTQIDLGSYTLDGNNHTLTLPSSGSTGGLVTMTNGTVSNLTLDCNGATLNASAGWIVGFDSSGTVSGCSTNGSITANSAGGIVGESFDGTVSDCTFTGTSVGTGQSAGGIAGAACAADISDCTSSANISGTQCGGIAGGMAGGSISRCSHSGTVGGTRCGGITGFIYSSTLISECKYTGSNVSSSNSGGILGYIWATGTSTIIQDCYAETGRIVGWVNSGSSSITVTVSNCYCLDTGDIFGTITYAGGTGKAITIDRCYASQWYITNTNDNWSVDTSNSSTDVASLSSSSSVPTGWSSSVWANSSGSYPTLKTFSQGQGQGQGQGGRRRLKRNDTIKMKDNASAQGMVERINILGLQRSEAVVVTWLTGPYAGERRAYVASDTAKLDLNEV